MTAIQECLNIVRRRVDVERDRLCRLLDLTSVEIRGAVPPLTELLTAHPEIWGAALVLNPEEGVGVEGLYVDLTDLSHQDRLFWSANPYPVFGPQRA